MVVRLFLFVCLFLIPFAPAQAQESYALTMHGAALHAPGWEHFDYVNPDAPKGGTLRQAAVGTFDTVNPFTLKGKAAQGLALVHDRLMDRSWEEPCTLYPLIARSVEVPADRSAITFHLDPRARFSDGAPLRAADVLYSFETLKTSGRPNMRRVYKLVAQATAPDDLTVRFVLGPGNDRETVMILAMMPVLSKAYWLGRNFDSGTLDPGVTSGPYRIARVDPGRQIVYARVKDYWAADLPVRRGLNNFDQVTYDYFRDESVAFEAFKSGALNFRREVDPTQWANAYDFPALQNGTVRREAIPHGRAEPVRGFIFNTRRAPFDDVRVREALSLAFDFEWVNAQLFSGLLKRTTSFFPNTDLTARGAPQEAELALLAADRGRLDPRVFGPAWVPPSTGSSAAVRSNLTRADALLKQAGWVVKDGVRVNGRDGKPLRFTILLGAPEDEKIALTYVRSLKRLGITADVRSLDNAAFIDRVQGYDYDVLFYFWTSTLSPGGEQLLFWGCKAAQEKGRFNYAGICDPLIDRLSSQIAQTTRREDLQAVAGALDRLLTFGFYAVPFGYTGADFVAYGSSLQRPASIPLYGLVPESWWQEPPAASKKAD